MPPQTAADIKFQDLYPGAEYLCSGSQGDIFSWAGLIVKVQSALSIRILERRLELVNYFAKLKHPYIVRIFQIRELGQGTTNRWFYSYEMEKLSPLPNYTAKFGIVSINDLHGFLERTDPAFYAWVNEYYSDLHAGNVMMSGDRYKLIDVEGFGFNRPRKEEECQV
jgi:hypothetical protein